MEHQSPTYIPRDIPFPHVEVQGVFGDSSIGDRIVSEIITKDWRREAGHAHHMWSLNAPLSSHPAVTSSLERITQHREFLQSHLRLALSVQPTINIFKLEDGDGVGFHDDAQVNSIRLVTKLHQDSSASHGGELLVTGGRVDNTYIYIMEPDCGICFPTQTGNYHAISTVSGEPAFFLVAQYQIVGRY